MQKLFLAAAAISLFAAPAGAEIIQVPASSIQGEVVLLNGSGTQTGNTVFGHTNQSNIGVTFDGNGQSLLGSGGQCCVSGALDASTSALTHSQDSRIG